jgi:hypothetical protein
MALQLQDLEQPLRSLIERIGKYPSVVTIGTGAKDIFIYVTNHRSSRNIISELPKIYRNRVHVIVTGRARPL